MYLPVRHDRSRRWTEEGISTAAQATCITFMKTKSVMVGLFLSLGGVSSITSKPVYIVLLVGGMLGMVGG